MSVTARAGRSMRGMDAVSAHAAALKALAGSIAREASMLAFEHVFLLAGLLFLLVIPLLFFLKVVRTPIQAPAEAHLDA